MRIWKSYKLELFLNVLGLVGKNMDTYTLQISVLKKSHIFCSGLCGEYQHLPSTPLSTSVWHLPIKQPTRSRLCMPVFDIISWPCFIYKYRFLKVSPWVTMYWLYRVTGIVQLLLVAGVICNRQFYGVKLLFTEMTNISLYSNIFRKYCLSISFLVDGIYVYLEKMLNQLINTKSIHEAI